MIRESPFHPYRFVRELQYAYALYFLNLQFALLGNSDSSIKIKIEKGFFSSTKEIFGKIRSGFFGDLLQKPKFKGPSINISYNPEIDYKKIPKAKGVLEFPEGTLKKDELEETDKAIFDFLASDWNDIYQQTRDKATVIGHISEFMIGKGAKVKDIKQMSIPEFNSELTNKYSLPGLDQIEDLMKETGLDKDRAYQLIYAQSKGAEWLAVYDENYKRSGKAYELITKMYRQQISEALIRGATLSDIRSVLVSPDDDEIKEALGLFEEGLTEKERLRREADYEFVVRKHLNRDMQRFAFTEVQINYNNGLLLRLANETDREKGTYVRFTKG